MAYTADNLLSSIERRSFAPSNQSTFTQAEILLLADEINVSELVPNIIKANEDYYIFSEDFTITANQAEYVVPARGLGSILKDVVVIDDNGNIRPLTRIEYSDQLSTTSGSSYDQYYMRDDKIVLYRTPSSTSGTLRASFFIEPGKLVLASAGAVISAINTSTNVVTVSTIPSTWSTGDIFDLISGTGSHSYRAIDKTSTLVSGNDITFSSLPSDLVVGDYVNVQYESSIVQLPSPYRAVLAQLVAAEILSNMNQPSADKAAAKAKKLMESAFELITPRVQDDTRVITPDIWF